MKNMYLECGKVCGAHGVRGVLKVESWCDSPRVLATRKKIYTKEPDGSFREHAVLSGSVAGPAVLLSLADVTVREEAVAMKNTVLYLAREDIPVKPGAALVADLIGLPVIHADTGRVLGTVRDITDAVRGKLYVVDTPEGEVLLPDVPVFIKEVDAGRGIFVRPIPGFFRDDEV